MSDVSLQAEEWAVALYDFTAETEGDLPFQQGDRILVTDHIDDEWWSGRMNGREGFFPKAFVEVATGKWTGAGNIIFIKEKENQNKFIT